MNGIQGLLHNGTGMSWDWIDSLLFIQFGEGPEKDPKSEGCHREWLNECERTFLPDVATLMECEQLNKTEKHMMLIEGAHLGDCMDHREVNMCVTRKLGILTSEASEIEPMVVRQYIRKQMRRYPLSQENKTKVNNALRQDICKISSLNTDYDMPRYLDCIIGACMGHHHASAASSTPAPTTAVAA